ncbi:MAG: glycosyltransferase family 4 protein [Patescibacteria group bacterium]|nr:glycosyltransferase family 4 protein [Patescibacteria group bacterium]
MKLLYITNARIPTEKAHGYQICKMCEEFSNLGHEVELILPKRENFIKETAFDFYGIKNNFKITYLKSFDFIKLDKIIGGRMACYLQELVFLLKLFFVKLNKEAIIYTRSAEIAWLFKIKNYKTIFEMHYWPESKEKIFKRMIRKIDEFVVITDILKEKLLKNDIKEKDIIVSPDGVDIDRFDINISKDDARAKINLLKDKNIIMYVGHLYGWKGAHILAESAKEFDNNTIFVFVGGTDGDIEKFKQKYQRDNIIIAGRKKHEEVPVYMKAADILVLPNTKAKKISSHYTSPLKMFEYMASGRPIIASDLPSIREVLDNYNAIFFDPGKPIDLAKKINYILNNPDKAGVLVENSLEKIKQHSWTKRAEKIKEFIKV